MQHNRVSHPGVYDFADNHDGSIELPMLQHLASAECKYTGIVVMNAIHRYLTQSSCIIARTPYLSRLFIYAPPFSNEDMDGIWAMVPNVAKFDAGSLGPDGTGVGACLR